jgi:DNA-binding NarL/FixJ family response regulator
MHDWEQSSMAVERQVPVVTTQDQIRVLIVADVRLYREGLAADLRERPNLNVVGVTRSLEEAVASSVALHPDVVVLDVAVRRSLAIIHAIRTQSQCSKVVAFAVAEVDHEILTCVEAGVSGYVTDECSMDDLVAAIENAVREEFLCSPKVAAMLIRRVASFSTTDPAVPFRSILTAREREISGLIEQGLSNKEIGARLNIEVATVKNHVHNILDKLHVATRGEAVAKLRRDSPLRSLRPTPPAPFTIRLSQ